MNSVIKRMNSVFKMMDFAFKMRNLKRPGGDGATQGCVSCFY